MSKSPERSPFDSITAEDQAEGIEYQGPSETVPEADKFQRELAFRNQVIEKYRDMLKDIHNPQQRSETIDRLIATEQRRQEKSSELSPEQQKEFRAWYQDKLNKGEGVSANPEERVEQFRREKGRAA